MNQKRDGLLVVVREGIALKNKRYEFRRSLYRILSMLSVIIAVFQFGLACSGVRDEYDEMYLVGREMLISCNAVSEGPELTGCLNEIKRMYNVDSINNVEDCGYEVTLFIRDKKYTYILTNIFDGRPAVCFRGPDGDFDVVSLSQKEMMHSPYSIIYDPTNGTYSDGDGVVLY